MADEDAKTSGTDYEIARVPEIIVALEALLVTIDAWTIPHPTGRRVHLHAGAILIAARARTANHSVGQARFKLMDHHSRLVNSGKNEACEWKALSPKIGWGGADYALTFACCAAHDRLQRLTVRATDAHTSGQLNKADMSVQPDDIISDYSMELLRSTVRVLKTIENTSTPFDPFAVLFPGMEYKGGVEAAEVVSPARIRELKKTNPELFAPPPRVRPTTVGELRDRLITAQRMAKHLSIQGSPAYLELRPQLLAIAAWKAPSGSGKATLYRVGELFDLLKLRMPNKVGALTFSEALVDQTEDADAIDSLVKKSAVAQSAPKRSKAPRRRKSARGRG